jgi:hypothetical protein
MTYLKVLFLAGILTLQLQNSFSQTTDWSLVNGKATAEKTILIPGTTQSDIYKDVYRWLIKVYKDPEDILKARLESEYLRGVGYYRNCVKFGSLSSADLQYSFTFEIKDGEVVFKLHNAFLLYSYSQDDDGVRPVEGFLIDSTNSKKKRKYSETEAVLSGLKEFSNTLFTSLESYLNGEDKN